METKSTIDLSMFCDEEISKYALGKPFLVSGRCYATDGRILIRMDDENGICPNDPDLKYPDTESLFTVVDSDYELEPIPFVFKPEGVDDNFKIDPDEFNFTVSSPDDWVAERSNVTWARHKSATQTIDFQGLAFAKMYLWKIAQLPGLKGGACVGGHEISEAKGEAGMLYFRFEGGDGLLMPMATDRA